MTRRDIPLGTVTGIPIGLDYSWFLIFGLLTWMLAVSYFPAEFHDSTRPLYWVMGAVTAIMMFASVVLHELGHALVARRFRIPVRGITLFVFGGVAQLEREPPSAAAELFIAIAGPIVSFALAVAFTLLEPAVTGIMPLWGVVKYLAYINFALALFNLIPGFPLDGGRVFRAIVWASTKNMERSTLIAANVGRFFGFFFIFLGVWQMLAGNFGGGLWLAFIGWFLDNAASVQAHQTVYQTLLLGHRVSQALGRQCTAIRADTTLQQLVDDHVLAGNERCFWVTRGGEIAGLVTLHRIKSVPRSEWTSTSAAQVMLPIDQWKRVDADAELWSAIEQMERGGVNQLPVMQGDRIVGMLTRGDVMTFLNTLQEMRA